MATASPDPAAARVEQPPLAEATSEEVTL